MEIRYSANQRDVRRYTTEELRQEFLIEELYRPDEITAVYSHVDRVVTLGCMPVRKTVSLEQGMDVWKCFGTRYFLERRELGLFNIGGKGYVTADGAQYEMASRDCLYVSRGTKDVTFRSEDPADPAKFFLFSAPAHKACPTKHIPAAKAAKRTLGSRETCNERTVYQFLHYEVLETCQIMMGLTELAPGSVWNTMPCHTHERRMEVYTYFDMPEGQRVFHMMGTPGETRHIVMKPGQAVISPSWSIHSGCGTSSYTMIWAMAGENQEYDDMDAIPMSELR